MGNSVRTMYQKAVTLTQAQVTKTFIPTLQSRLNIKCDLQDDTYLQSNLDQTTDAHENEQMLMKGVLAYLVNRSVVILYHKIFQWDQLESLF